MSHFVVAVFTEQGQNIEDLLEPFDENLEVEPYVRFTKEEILKEIDEQCAIDEDFAKTMQGLSDQEKISEWRGYELFDKNGNPLSTYNPNSKWDWYSIGGRWSGFLTTKSGEKTDSCLVKDLDLSPNKDIFLNAMRFWEINVEKQPLKKGEQTPFSLYSPEHYLKMYRTKEEYAMEKARFITYAVLLPNGEWLEPGEMGYFGISNASIDDKIAWSENYHKIFEQAEDDWEITIVDCHI